MTTWRVLELLAALLLAGDAGRRWQRRRDRRRVAAAEAVRPRLADVRCAQLRIVDPAGRSLVGPVSLDHLAVTMRYTQGLDVPVDGGPWRSLLELHDQPRLPRLPDVQVRWVPGLAADVDPDA